MHPSILVVDDEPRMQQALQGFLRAAGYRVATAGSATEALLRIEEQRFDVIVAEMLTSGVSGLTLLERSRMLNPAAAVVLTGHATVDTAIEALRKGASDYLQKPFQLDDLGTCVERVLRGRVPGLEPRPRPLPPSAAEDLLVGESIAIRTVRRQIARCAPTASNVLVTGESGTGKELVARAVHALSPRRDRPLVPVNCGAIPETLLESYLFGHVRGAFTGAVHANPGLFAAADGGTLLLDEVAELPPLLQVKLLRVIEERQVWPVGATRPLALDVRIIASTNRDLAREIAAERFRADLFYRLNVVHLALPPLRECREDIPLLADHLIRRLNRKLGCRFLGVDPEALRALMNHGWNGNVRELENVLERAMIMGDGDGMDEMVERLPELGVFLEQRPAPPRAPADGAAGRADGPPDGSGPAGDLVRLRHLAETVTVGDPALRPANLRDAVRLFERQHIQDVLAQSDFDKREAARRLGISLASLYRKLSGEGATGPAPDEE
jgi:DNA-binding NtrC family response regulator